MIYLWGYVMAMRVFLANEYEIVREGLKSVISKNSSLNIVGEYNGVGDLYMIVERLKPNLLFVDITNSESRIVKSVRRIKERYPKLYVIAIIYNLDKNIIDELLSININGIFSKNLKIDELVKGVTEVLLKGFYMQSKLLDGIEKDTNNGAKSDKYKINSLTKRELEVLIQVANGMFNKEIAIALNISERTVKNHLSNIFKKIEVSDRTQAAVFAIKNEIVMI